jgi:MraZ protein
MVRKGIKWSKVEQTSERAAKAQRNEAGAFDYMLVGEHLHSLDSKGRMIIPSKFRNDLGVKFMLTKGLDKCLFAYPLAEWEKTIEHLKHLSFTKAAAREFLRMFFSGAEEMEIDRQGRVAVPCALRHYAGLERDIYIIGVSSRLEIWDKNTWQDYRDKAFGRYEEIAETINDIV